MLVADEFGHDGKFVSRTDDRYSSSPLFGYAALVVPYNRAYQLNSAFVQFKRTYAPYLLDRPWPEAKGARVLDARLYERDEITGVWRSGGKIVSNKSKLITGFLNLLEQHDVKIGYSGWQKFPGAPVDARGFHLAGTKKIVSLVDKYIGAGGGEYLAVFDGHSLHKERQGAILDTILPDYYNRRLIDTPMMSDSDTSQLVQAADWAATLLCHIQIYRRLPAFYPELLEYARRFGARVDALTLDRSSIIGP